MTINYVGKMLNAFEMRKISLQNNQEFQKIYSEIGRRSKIGQFKYTFAGTISGDVMKSLTILHYKVITSPLKTDKTCYNITILW